MEQQEHIPLKSYIRRASFTIACLVPLIMVLIWVVSGLLYAYKFEHRLVKQYAQELAFIASNCDFRYQFAQQSGYLIDNTPVSDISFIATDNELFIAHKDVIQHDIFFKNSAEYQQIVFLNSPLGHSLTSFTPNNKNPNPCYEERSSNIIGYVIIKVDLQQIRNQWFVTHSVFLALAILGCFLIYGYGYIKLRRPFVQFSKLSDSITRIYDSKSTLTISELKHHISFDELVNVQQTINFLIEKYVSIDKEIATLQKTFYQNGAVSSEGTHTVNAQYKGFQNRSAHELKASLTAIASGINLFSDQYLTDEQQEALNIVNNSYERLDVTLDQIISLNEIIEGKLSVNESMFEPLQLIADVMAENKDSAAAKNLELISVAQHVNYPMMGDALKIKTILGLLVSNAIQFTQTGRVTILSKLLHLETTTRWHLSVIDTGIGIDKQYLDQVFEPFFQIDVSNQSGMGLGLSLAKQLATLLGGNIFVDSTLGKGSEFNLIISILDKEIMLDKNYLKGTTVLLLQSDHSYRMQDTLKQYGADAVIVYTVDKAIEHIYQNIEHRQRGNYDALFINHSVSDKAVRQLVQRMRELEENHRCLVLRQNMYQDDDIDQDSQALFEVGVDVVLPSDCSDKAVAKEIKRWLER